MSGYEFQAPCMNGQNKKRFNEYRCYAKIEKLIKKRHGHFKGDPLSDGKK